MAYLHRHKYRFSVELNGDKSCARVSVRNSKISLRDTTIVFTASRNSRARIASKRDSPRTLAAFQLCSNCLRSRVAIRREISATGTTVTIYSGGCRRDKPRVCCSRRLAVGSCVEVNPSLTSATAELYRPDAERGAQQSRAPGILCVWVREGRTWNYEITGFDA